MESIEPHVDRFRAHAIAAFGDLFGIQAVCEGDTVSTESLQTDRPLIVSVQYTGMVHGEYVLAMTESTAAGLIGWTDEICEENLELFEESIADALSECQNIIVGESITELQREYGKITFTAPRVTIGSIRYPRCQCAMAKIATDHGEIECHLCLDTMRLDLATSYEDAMQSLIQVNSKLEHANETLRQQQAQLVQSEKMASIGLLASGVAHEINTPLFFVDANLQTMNDYVSVIEAAFELYDHLCDSLKCENGQWATQLRQVAQHRSERDLPFVLEDTKHLVHETRTGVDQIQRVVQGLKGFCESGSCGSSEVDLNRLVANACQLCNAGQSTGIQIETSLSDIPKVVGSEPEMGQVIAAVLTNAFQSCDSEGQIRVATEVNEGWVSICIEDNGCGIAPEHLEHLFEPFFTTKPEGSGTGLGLSIAYGIMQKHQGKIDVQSHLNKGTQVAIRMPVKPSAEGDQVE